MTGEILWCYVGRNVRGHFIHLEKWYDWLKITWLVTKLDLETSQGCFTFNSGFFFLLQKVPNFSFSPCPFTPTLFSEVIYSCVNSINNLFINKLWIMLFRCLQRVWWHIINELRVTKGIRWKALSQKLWMEYESLQTQQFMDSPMWKNNNFRICPKGKFKGHHE